MGFTYPPIIGDSPLYNPRFYPSIAADGMLTCDFAQALYLSKNDFRLSYLSGVIPGSATSGGAIVLDETLSFTGIGALSCTSLTINGVEAGSSPYLAGITPGTAAAEKALVLYSSRNITNINSLSATTLTGTIGTAAQPNITAVGSLTSLKVSSTLTQIVPATSLADSYDMFIVKASATDGQTSSLAFLISANPTSVPTGAIVATRTGVHGVGTMAFLIKGTTMLRYTDTTLSAKNLSLDLSGTGISAFECSNN